MWRFIVLGVVIIAVLVAGFSLIDTSASGDVNASAVLADTTVDTSGFAQAIGPWDWQFPADYGAHPDFQTEWWYYTGNLATDSERRFGYQFTIFRRAIAPQSYDTESEWRTNQIYMAHFTITDVDGETFYHDERFSRASAGLAGAETAPVYRVWLEDWAVEAQNDDATLTRISASMDNAAVDLTLEQVKPPALQGQGGLSPKSEETGNASYYYSLSRLVTDGTVTIDGETFAVSGRTWKDHEFSTSALGDNALGWDWFGLIFDDNRELMLGQIRQQGGDTEPAFGGLLVDSDGSTRYLAADIFTLTPTGTWTSPHTGGVYPSGWQVSLTVPDSDDVLNFTLTPLLDDQELHGNGIIYWEGAVRIDGDVSGYGYAELTGYVDAMTGRF
ncbi:MAG: carotenoid 1,2-hydratase [Anaerolineaceae bacterium]|nr:carotenoid 1,2-hydratase [Anaerolineaceae bacterium]